MKKVVLISFAAVVFALMISSCAVLQNPQKALENIQNPNIEIRTKVNIPLVATSISVGDFVTNSFENVAAGSIGGQIVNKDGQTYIYLKKDATLLNLEEVNDKLKEVQDTQSVASFSQKVDINLTSNVVSLPVLDAQETNIEFSLPGVPEEEEYILDSTKTDIDLGITSDDVASITVNGDLVLSFSTTWSDVSVVSIDATLTDGEGNVVAKLQNKPVSDDQVSIDLTNKDLVLGKQGTITIEYSLTLNSGSVHTDEGTVTIAITPDLSLAAFKDASVSYTQQIELPDDISDLSFRNGSIVLSSNGVRFDGIDGSFGNNSLEVKDGDIVVPLFEVSLPAQIKINKVSGHFVGDSQSEITFTGRFSDDTKIETLTMELSSDQKPSFEGSETIDLPDKPTLSSLTFNSGYIRFLYSSKLPVEVNLKIWSDQIKNSDGSNFVINKTIGCGDDSIDISFDGLSVVPDGTQIVFYYDASPVGYEDGETPKLTIKDTPLSSLSNISFDATVSYGDFSLRSVTIADISQSATDSIDLSEGGDFLELIAGLDANGTLTLNLDMNGSIEATLNAYKENVLLDSTNVNVSVKNGIAKLDPLFDGFKYLIDKEPDRIDYEAAFSSKDITIDFTGSKYATMTFEFEIPAKMTLESSKLVREYEDTIDKQDFPKGATITTAVLIIEGTNTTGITPTVDFIIDEKKISTVDFEETFSGSIVLNEDVIKKIESEGIEYKFDVWLPEGVQEFKENGKIDLRLKLSSDIIVSSSQGGE